MQHQAANRCKYIKAIEIEDRAAFDGQRAGDLGTTIRRIEVIDVVLRRQPDVERTGPARRLRLNLNGYY